MNQRICNIAQSGQTIVEVLVAVAVMGLVLTAVAAMFELFLSVKNSAETRSKALATQRAQEAIEVFRRERKVQGWTAFVTNVPDGVVCLNELPTNSDEFNTLNTGACSDGVAEAGTEFTRQALVSFPSSEIVTIEATVSWLDGNKPRSVVVTQQLQDSL